MFSGVFYLMGSSLFFLKKKKKNVLLSPNVFIFHHRSVSARI